MKASRPFHIMTKPIGPKCNLDCKYCFYLEKESLWSKSERYQMSDKTLENYIQSYIETNPSDTVSFAWQGGEPTLMGVSFFQRVVDLQEKFANGKTISNAFQTNGTLLNDEWGSFFATNHFLVGLSIDGPQKIHDAYRVGKNGSGSWSDVMQGLEILKSHQVEWNSLTCVHRGNANKALDVYRFLKGIGSKHMQFIPIVERKPNAVSKQLGLSLGCPEALDTILDDEQRSPVMPWSVRPNEYGQFLNSIFDRWVSKDVGKIFIQINEATLGKYLGLGAGLCIFEETCGNGLAMEHDGSLFSCDHYVYPSHKLGNIKDQGLAKLVDSNAQIQFGNNKRETLPQQCIECPVRALCNGGCPKQRFINDRYGNPGLNYLCEAYFQYFTHTAPHMQKMAALYKSGRPPADIMN